MANTEVESIFKIEYIRLKGRLLAKSGQYKDGSTVMAEGAKSNEDQLYILWRDWQTLNYKAYQKSNGQIEWLKSAIACLPYSLRYQPQKTRLQLAQIFVMLYDNM